VRLKVFRRDHAVESLETRQTHTGGLPACVLRPGVLIRRTAVPQCFRAGGRGSEHILVGFPALYVRWVESFLRSGQSHGVAFLVYW
jgi:hypothetical protein